MDLFRTQRGAARLVEQELLLLVRHAIHAGLTVELSRHEIRRLIVPARHLRAVLLLVAGFER